MFRLGACFVYDLANIGRRLNCMAADFQNNVTGLQPAFCRLCGTILSTGARRGPTGTISLLGGNVSSRLEPIFAASYNRKVLVEDGTAKNFVLTDYALRRWCESSGQAKGLPVGFVTASELSVRTHIAMRAALQPYVDNSISKTINVPSNYPLSEFKQIYDLAYDHGLKGCTTFRPNSITETVLSEGAARVDAPLLCSRTGSKLMEWSAA